MSRELDIEVATKVMGWQAFPYQMPGGTYCCPPGTEVHISTTRQVPKYSSDPAAMMEVIERMTKNGWDFEAKCDLRPVWTAEFIEWNAPEEPNKFAEGEGATLPEAVCRAALTALAAGGGG